MTLPLAGAKAQQWTTNALPPGLVAWWQAEGNFTETVGNLVTTPSGGPQFVADGRIGQAVRFNGSSQWARITSGGLARARGEVTVAAWIRPRGSQGGSYTWGHVWFESTGSTYGGADTYTRLSLTVNSGGTVRMTGRDSEDGTVFAVNTTNPYAISIPGWLAGFGLTGSNADYAADPDGDVLKNIFEYGFNLNPTNAASVAFPTASINAGYMVLTYRERTGGTGTVGVDYTAAGLTYTVQVTTDIAGTWQSGAALVEIVPGTRVDNGDGTETVTVSLKQTLSSSTRKFVRLVLTPATL